MAKIKLYLIVIMFLQCATEHSKAVFTYPFENAYNLPSEIISNLKLNAYETCVSSFKDNLFQKGINLSAKDIDSICKLASIGIPYQRHWLRSDIPLCSLTCGKPAEYYFHNNSYRWIIPILLDSMVITELQYIKDLPMQKNKLHSSKNVNISDSIWIWIGSGFESNRYCVLKACFEKYHSFPIFIGYNHGYCDLFTIPGHEKEIFGNISPTDNVEKARIKCIKPEDPCEAITYARSIETNNIEKPHQAIVRLPDAYKEYRKRINSSN